MLRKMLDITACQCFYWPGK